MCEDGRIIVPRTPFLAGSGVFTDACIGNAVMAAGITLAQAIDMASARPRELLGLPTCRLKAGEPAQLMLFEWDARCFTVSRLLGT